MSIKPFPIGGSKDAVFSFLQKHGFVMSDWSDKHWTRADGLRLHIYGTGSMARIIGPDDKLIIDEPIQSIFTCAAWEKHFA